MSSHRLPAPAPRPDEFEFVLLSDRTGMARPGVFERAVEVTNMVRPAFAIQLGDTIEGYTADPATLSGMWTEADAITDALDVPLFRVPGNHDVGNEMMRTEWIRRHGPLHYHFRFGDVLFLVLDTQDPPQPLLDMLRPADAATASELPRSVRDLLESELSESELVAEIGAIMDNDPQALQGLMSSLKSGTQPAAIGDAQVEAMERAIAEHDDVAWTFLCMHMPAWQGHGHPALDRLRAAIGSRPYTAFAGHCHNYRRTVIDGRDHVRLGPSGGARVLDTAEGDFDHITTVTMTAGGPRIANIVLDGVLGVEGGAFAPSPRPLDLIST